MFFYSIFNISTTQRNHTNPIPNYYPCPLLPVSPTLFRACRVYFCGFFRFFASTVPRACPANKRTKPPSPVPQSYGMNRTKYVAIQATPSRGVGLSTQSQCLLSITLQDSDPPGSRCFAPSLPNPTKNPHILGVFGVWFRFEIEE